jgi:hypothetical protein
LTARQKIKTGIAQKVSVIDVTVASNQMHLSQSTIPKLSDACSQLVRSVDQDISMIIRLINPTSKMQSPRLRRTGTAGLVSAASGGRPFSAGCPDLSVPLPTVVVASHRLR